MFRYNVTACFLICLCSAGILRAADNPERTGYVCVTPDGPLDGGDFGRFTLGTRTAGIQEAIDYALGATPQMNVWISGKQDDQNVQATYHVHQTIRVPPTQGFTIDGTLYVLSYAARRVRRSISTVR